MQYEVENNLDALISDIRATSRALASAVRSRNAILQTSNVQWDELAKHDLEIEAYERGLARLKYYREVYFPNWKSITTED